MTTTGSATTRDIQVEVAPGGALVDLRIEDQALRRGGHALAQDLLALVDRATAVADQRARNELSLTTTEATTLGLTTDEASTERAETTTPDSWRQQ